MITIGGTVQPLPEPHYIDVILPGSTDVIFRYDPARGIVEVQRKRVKYWIDLTTLSVPVETAQELCYNSEHD